MNSLQVLAIVLVIFSISLNLISLVAIHRLVVKALLEIRDSIIALKEGEG